MGKGISKVDCEGFGAKNIILNKLIFFQIFNNL